MFSLPSNTRVGKPGTTLLACGLAILASGLSAISLAAEPPASSPAAATPAPQKREANANAPRSQPKRQPDQTTVFKTTPQGDLKLQIYLPPDWKAGDKRPGMVFWFGGGFAVGTPAQFYHAAEYFAGRGLVCACAEYRIKNTHGTGIDKCVEDARSAMRWIKAHHGELGIDPARVIASGGSAGGTLALLTALGTGPDAQGEDTSVSPRPAALVLFNPAQGEPVAHLADRPTEDREANQKALSPLNEPQKDMVPAIFFFGTADKLLEFSQQFAEKSLAVGNRCELWSAAGQSHGFFNRQPWQDATLRKADEFLGSLGFLKGEPTVTPPTDGVLKRELPK